MPLKGVCYEIFDLQFISDKLVLVVPVDEQSIIEDMNTSEQVPFAQNNFEQVPFAQDNGEGEDVLGKQVWDQPGDEEEELTNQAELTRPDPDPDPNDAAVGAASDTESV